MVDDQPLRPSHDFKLEYDGQKAKLEIRYVIRYIKNCMILLKSRSYLVLCSFYGVICSDTLELAINNHFAITMIIIHHLRRDAQPDDTGTYKVRISNEYGTAESVAELKVGCCCCCCCCFSSKQ